MQQDQSQPDSRSRIGNIVRLIISLVLLSAAAWLLLNRQLVQDSYAAWSYQPSPQIEQLASATTMNDQGRFYFYASQPALQERQTFNESCRAVADEHAAVLGCYSDQRIFIFNVDDQRLDGIEEVTAAHEMLHAAYDRLAPADKSRINELLTRQLETVEDDYLKELLAKYQDLSDDERLNEVHSILGSQLAELDDELESYYTRYFSDRSKLVALSAQYESVFRELEERQRQLVEQLDKLHAEIATETSRYNQAATAYQSEVEAYNANPSSQSERQRLLNRQSELRAWRSDIEADRQRYNQLVAELDELNKVSVSLNHSINSNLEPLESVD